MCDYSVIIFKCVGILQPST